MANDNLPIIEKSKILLVEGKDEENVLYYLLNSLSLQETIQIERYEEIPSFKDFLEFLKTRPGYSDVESIGILRDADERPKSAFQSVQNALEKAGFPKPRTNLKTVGDKPKITVMILPDINTKGALESLLMESIEEESTLVCVNDFINCLKKNEIVKKENTSKIAKTKLYSYLASRKKPGLKIGEAAKAKYWNFDSNSSFTVEKDGSFIIKGLRGAILSLALHFR